MQGAAPAELEGKKANLVTDMQSQEWLKEKKKKEYSVLFIVFFIFFVLRKGKEKNHFSLFYPFSLQHKYLRIQQSHRWE